MDKDQLFIFDLVVFTCDSIECVGWRRHSSLIFLKLLFTKPNLEVSGWLYQTKTHINHIVYQPLPRETPLNYTALNEGLMVF